MVVKYKRENGMKVTVKSLKIGLIKSNKGQIEGLPKNPRFIKDESYERLKQSIMDDPEMLELREVIVYPHGKDYIAICGNMRLRAMQDLGYKEVTCKVLDKSTTIEQLKAYTIKDNNSFGEYDEDLLALEWNAEELEEWGTEMEGVFKEELGEGDVYTKKIGIPIYEPTGEKPNELELYDTDKTDQLVKKINEANITNKELKKFLLIAAQRHTRIDFEKVAEYYAHAPANVQELMEQSALVIIDMGRAIEEGYVKLSNEVENQYREENGKL